MRRRRAGEPEGRRSAGGIDEHVYRRAALERIGAAFKLLEQQQHVEVYYLCGVAVECMLRAYRTRINPEFDARHELLALAGLSGIYERMRPELRQEVDEKLGEVAVRWSNNHRYRSVDSLRSYLEGADLDRLPNGNRITGDVVSYNLRTILDAADFLVKVGDQRWNRKL